MQHKDSEANSDWTSRAQHGQALYRTAEPPRVRRRHKRQTRRSGLKDDWPQLVLSRFYLPILNVQLDKEVVVQDAFTCSSSETSRERAVSRVTPNFSGVQVSNHLTLVQHDTVGQVRWSMGDADFREVADRSHGALTEMRAANGCLHTVQALCGVNIHRHHITSVL